MSDNDRTTTHCPPDHDKSKSLVPKGTTQTPKLTRQYAVTNVLEQNVLAAGTTGQGTTRGLSREDTVISPTSDAGLKSRDRIIDEC
ncbi:unnamed protein product [Somion occarium]|uniref:Uncharacterized protein n=1 Tax=Somion occarium TaxID=3059160 RepID=A0ABP1ECY0_9APHY